MTLISNSNVASVAPDQIRVVVLEEDVDAITLNTDIKVHVSRDGGTTYTEAVLVKEGNFTSSIQVLAALVNVSSQPAGTSLKYKIVTDNLKILKIHGVALNWA
jgi:hypothetical protein